MMELADAELVTLGLVVGTRGLLGEIKVRGFAGDASLLSRVRDLVFLREGAVLDRCVRASARWHGGLLLLRLDGRERVEAVQDLVGCRVAVYRRDVPPRTDGRYYWFELQGLTALDRRLGEIGRLEEIFTTPAHDIYVVRGPYGEVLIPAVDAFLVEVDRPAGHVLFDLPEGLVQET